MQNESKRSDITNGSIVRIAFLALLLSGLQTTTSAAASVEAPNFVFILVDDLGIGDLSTLGADHVQTPRLDRLANEGMRFERYYSSTVCSPTRVRLLTGQSPQRLGIRRQIPLSSFRGIPDEVTTLPELLKESGYRTAHYGKWHLGRNQEHYLPFAQGFEEGAFRTDFLYNDASFQFPDDHVEALSGHSTEVITDFALDYLDENADSGQFFLSLWYFAPHGTTAEPDKTTKYFPPEEWARQYEDTEAGRRSAQIGHLDDQIGRILDRLETLGLDEDTMVIFASDNGAPYLEGILPNGDYQGYKGKLLEGGILSPLFVRWRGRIGSATTFANIVIAEDVLPTIAEMVGYDLAELDLDGRSFLPALKGVLPPTRPESLFWEFRPRTKHEYEDDHLLNDYAVRQKEWKLVVTANSQDRSNITQSLYNLVLDPYELTDVAAENRGIVQDLNEAYSAWRHGLEIPAVVQELRGEAMQTGDTFTFDDVGQVRYSQSSRFDIADGDFAFTTVVTASAATFNDQESEIVNKKDALRLTVLPSGQVRLSIDEQNGRRVTLDSETTLAVDQPTRISFIIKSWKDWSSDIRLYLDDRLEAHDTESLKSVRTVPTQVRLGSRGNGMGTSFFGTIDRPRFFPAALSLEELLALDNTASSGSKAPKAPRLELVARQ